MAVKDTVDHARIGTALSEWLSSRSGGPVEVANLEAPTAGGFSSETVLFDVIEEGGDPRRMVLRIEPTEAGAYPDYDVLKQFRVVDTLAGSAVPVPRLVGYEPDVAVLGTPFFVMDCVEGRVPRDDPPFTVAGWVLDDLDDEQRGTLYDNGLGVLAAVHAIDPQAADLDFLVDPDLAANPLRAQVDYYHRFYEWGSEGVNLTPIDEAFEWIEANMPRESEAAALSWGDARPGNMIFGPDLSVRAVLDWEMASLASPELDLGWWVFFDRYYTDGLGVPRPAGFPQTREETLEKYSELTGHTVRHIDFYEAFAGLRGSTIAIRLARLLKDAGLLPADSDMALSNPAIQTMASLMGLRPPSENASSFISKAASS